MLGWILNLAHRAAENAQKWAKWPKIEISSVIFLKLICIGIGCTAVYTPSDRYA